MFFKIKRKWTLICIFFLGLFFIVKMILNYFKLEYRSWIYYCISFLILLFIIYKFIIYIVSNFTNKLEVIFKLFFFIPIITIGYYFLVWIVFYSYNLPHEKIVKTNFDKYVECNDFFEIHPHNRYYQYVNPFIRSSEEERFLFIDGE